MNPKIEKALLDLKTDIEAIRLANNYRYDDIPINDITSEMLEVVSNLLGEVSQKTSHVRIPTCTPLHYMIIGLEENNLSFDLDFDNPDIGETTHPIILKILDLDKLLAYRKDGSFIEIV